MFTLKIKTDNAAFEEDDDKTDNKAAEVARILRKAADKVEAGHEEGNLLDINGNTVGSFKLTNR